MGAAVGTDDKKSVNVELNIVPFIDLMSCLTAFLLVTAVWVNIAQMKIQPKGKSRESDTPPVDPPKELSVLITADKIWVGVSIINEFQEIAKGPDGAHDWAKFETTLEEHRKSADFADRSAIEIAAESTLGSVVKYEDIIHAMDIAVKHSFFDVGLSDPAGLAARPTL
jgi:biopolymer transport protein ExbD